MKKKNIAEDLDINEQNSAEKIPGGENQEPQAAQEQEITLEGGNNTSQTEASLLDEYQRKIEAYEKEKQELIEKIKLTHAELINYRKRKDEEPRGMLQYANQDLINEIIIIVDNFESAIKLESKSENPEVTKYLTVFQMMYSNLVATLN